MQRIRSTVDEKEQKQLLMDLDVVMMSNECPYIVQFYGALFKEVSNITKCAFIFQIKQLRVNILKGDCCSSCNSKVLSAV